MLTAAEKKGFRQILNQLSPDEVNALKDTVTRKQIVTHGKDEAIDAIVTFSETAPELLKRRKVKRDVLFWYLAANKVPVNPATEKHQLIRKILILWGSHFNDAEIEDTLSAESVLNRRMLLPDIEQEVAKPSDLIQGSVIEVHSSDTVQPATESTGLVTKQVAAEPVVPTQSQPDKNLEFGKQFVQWYYKILNSHNPSLQSFPDGEFGPQHFWSDCRLEMKSVVQGEVNSENFEGSGIVAHRFLALVKEERLLFNPNVDMDGIKVKSEPHGLVLVLTCGTLHRVSECLGVFEQLFGLVSDPTMDNNWKVKISKLTMKSSQHASVPKLECGEKILAIGL